MWGPGPVLGVDTIELLERDEQLSALGAALSDVTGRCAGLLVLVHGEAGIGKTALLRRFCTETRGSARVLWATCEPLFTPRPMGPLLDIARVTGGELGEQVEAGSQPHDVARALMDELARPAPSVVVIEDLHWADEATLDVLRLCARRVGSVPALLIATYRDDSLRGSHPLRAMLGELPSGLSRRHELTRLSRGAVATLAEASAIDPGELYERTSGNPFYVTEVLAAGSDRIPATVRDAVLARAAGLSGAARDVLEAVAVVPQRTEVWLLEALVQRALDGLDECLESGMLRGEADGVAFRHELARLAIEESLTPHRAVVLHRRALAALGEAPLGLEDLARLAHHAEAAGDPAAVLRYAPLAAERAAAVGAHREAQHQYGRALRFAAGLEPEQRADLLERFADQGYLTDMREEAVEALDQAVVIHREAGYRVKAGNTLRLRSRLQTCMGRTAEARVDAVDAIQLLEQSPPGIGLARAYAALSHVGMLSDDAEETIASGTRAIALADEFGDTEALVNALNNVGTIELTRGELEGAEKLERSLALARSAGLGTDVGRAYINMSAALAQLGRHLDMARYIEPGIEYCRERGLDAWTKCLVALKADNELARGLWDQAAETAKSIIDAPPAPVIGPVHDALRVRALIERDAGTPTTVLRSSALRRSLMRWETCSSLPPGPPHGLNVRGSKAASRQLGQPQSPPSSSRASNGRRRTSASSHCGGGERDCSTRHRRTPASPTHGRSPAIGTEPRATGARTDVAIKPLWRLRTPVKARHSARRWTSSRRWALDPQQRSSLADCASSASAGSREGPAQRRARTRPASPPASSRFCRYWPRVCATHRSPNDWSYPRRPSTTTSQRSCASWAFTPAVRQAWQPDGLDFSIQMLAPVDGEHRGGRGSA